MLKFPFLSPIQPTLVKQSKRTTTNLEDIAFGSVFTDHMLVCDYKNGVWETPKIEPYAPFTLAPSARVFHYGQAIFEGMKAYKDTAGEIWLFRPDENYKRFNKSAVRLAMPEIPEAIFLGGLQQLLTIEKEWILNEEGSALYIRPFMIATGEGVKAAPSDSYKFIIILSPTKAYYSGKIKVIVAEHYSRAANGGIGAAKAAGNYSGQFYPTQLANNEGFQQIIWTDDATHTKLEEAGTMNVFFRINNTLITAPVSDRILDGITRKSLLEIAKKENINIDVRPVLVSEIVTAAKNGSLKEIFGAGTAVVVSVISEFSYRGNTYKLPEQKQPMALFLKEKLTNIQYKIEEDTFNWTIQV